jgi:hypothetical protein
MSESHYVEKTRYLRFFQENEIGRSGREEEIRTTPLFSLSVKCLVEKYALPSTSASFSSNKDRPASPSSVPVLSQFGLLGFHIGEHTGIDRKEPIMLNINAPNSTFICGSQGSGKSYTLSCILENCLLVNRDLGIMHQPVAGVVFHYDTDSANSAVAEAASLCSRGIRVRVLVSPSNKRKLQDAYSRLPGAAQNLEVVPLMLSDKHLSVERMLRLMAFSEAEGSVPLYMEVIQRILRQMAIAEIDFTMTAFEQLLNQENFAPGQRAMMDMRLNLLRSFLVSTRSQNPRRFVEPGDLFESTPGTLTVVDLSDPFIDTATVCVLFEICLGLVKERRPKAGLVIALDEAHKFLNGSSAAASFTDRLLTTIREQRHNATRVLIATQEPTLSSKLLDLCSVCVVHQFKSPAWFAAIQGHLGGASGLIAKGREQEKLFESIVNLGTGESLVFAPGAFVCVNELIEPGKLGAGVMKMKTRKRVGADEGMSVLASDVTSVGTIKMLPQSQQPQDKKQQPQSQQPQSKKQQPQSQQPQSKKKQQLKSKQPQNQQPKSKKQQPQSQQLQNKQPQNQQPKSKMQQPQSQQPQSKQQLPQSKTPQQTKKAQSNKKLKTKIGI